MRAALLLFSVGYATVAAVCGPRRGRVWTLGRAARWAVGIAALSFAIRLRFAIDTFQIGSLHVWQGAQCLGLFVLGTLLGQRGVAPVSDRLLRACRWGLATGAVGSVALLAVSSDLELLGGGWHWQSALVALLEGVMSVASSVVVLSLARHASAPRPGVARAAYGAYVVQAPAIVGISLLLRPIEVPVLVKLLLLAPVALIV